MKLRIIIAVSILLELTACVHPGQNVYGSGEAGTSHDIVLGKVISARPIEIKNANTGVGLLGGGVTGAAAGSATNSAWGTLGGALVGAVAGQVIENNVNNRDGLEYIVRTDDGKLKTITQEKTEGDVIFQKGDRVMIQYCDAGEHYKRCQSGKDYQRVLPVPPELQNYRTPQDEPVHHRKKKLAPTASVEDAADTPGFEQ